jgi:hypothetical protein
MDCWLVAFALKKTQVYKWHERFNDNLHCGLEVFFDAQGLIYYEFIPEGHIVNKEMYVKILCCLRMQCEGHNWKNGRETAWFYCRTMHLHIGHW